jgi:cation diffusion facilitator family transporter
MRCENGLVFQPASTHTLRLTALADCRHAEGHADTHGIIDPTIATTDRGIWAIKWSFVILAATALLQLVVVYFSGSVALLADSIHNIGDATTAIPLWIAFVLARRKPTQTFTHGYGRIEDIAGLLIVLIILFSAIVAAYEAIDRLIHPKEIAQLSWVALAGLIGFLGNEAVAIFRIKVGRQINSAALVADGYHARTDGLTSLAVVLGAFGVWIGFPLADPLIGLLITIAILGIVWQSARAVVTRMLDGVEPEIISEIRHAAEHVPGIEAVTQVKARWVGHRLHAEVTIAIDENARVAEANRIAAALRRELHEHIPALGAAVVSFAVTPAIAHEEALPKPHHHDPEPVKILGKLVEGTIAIVDTPAGERFRFNVARHAKGLRARVTIARPGSQPETLALFPAGGDHHCLMSAVAPAEPHEFSASLHLSAGDDTESLSFSMAESEHRH